jgi:hypothetical protein
VGSLCALRGVHCRAVAITTAPCADLHELLVAHPPRDRFEFVGGKAYRAGAVITKKRAI